MVSVPSGIYEERIRIRSYHTDATGRLKLSALFSFFQEGASMDAERLGFGFEDMKSQNRLWLLARLLVKIQDLPLWREEITIKTWPKDSSGIMAFRDFEVTLAPGKLIAAGTSTWTQVDLNTRRPIRIEMDDFTKVFPRIALNDRPAKILIGDHYEWSEEFSVKFSHLDVNWHVNNIRYLEWVINKIPVDWHKEKKIMQFEANFLNESHLGDRLTVGHEVESDTVLTGLIRRIRDNREVYAARFNFEPVK